MWTGIYGTEFALSISLNHLIMMIVKVKAIMVHGNNVLLHSLLFRLVLPGSEQWGTRYQVAGTCYLVRTWHHQ